MSWVDSMRLRRKADIVRWVGWSNLFLSVVWSLFHVSDGLGTLGLIGLWAFAFLALTHAIAWVIDRRADRVVRR